MRKLLLTAVAAATVAAGPGATLALAHSGEHRQHHPAAPGRRHHRPERFGAIPGAPAGATGPTGVTGPIGPPLPAPQSAGMVASFANGVLTIRLNNGTTVSGAITDATRLGCEPLAGRQAGDGDRNDNDGNGGNRGSNNSGGGGDGGGPGGGPGDDEGNGNVSCTLAAVTPGTVVEEAELQVSSSGGVWESLLLVA
jgi:hypothetical protein